MIKTMQIEFVRELLKYHFNDNDISLYSFFEELTSQDEVNRYVENFNELCSQLNKSDKIGFGILAITDQPSFINLNKHNILPFEWGCSIRTTLANRDYVIGKVYDVIEKIKGRKHDIAVLDNKKLFPVGTIGNYDMIIHDGDFIGTITALTNAQIQTRLVYYGTLGFSLNVANTKLLYAEYNGKIYRFEYNTTTSEWENTTSNSVAIDIDHDGTTDYTINYANIPTHTSFAKWKISISCDSVKVQQPFTLNSEEYCDITFGGSATICPNNVSLGNDITRVFFRKYKLIISDTANQNISFANTWYDIEPLEINNGTSFNSISNQIKSNLFTMNSHNDNATTTLKYTFVLDKSVYLLKAWYEMARYGKILVKPNDVWEDTMSPNIIYQVKEIYSSWGEIETELVIAKISSDGIDIENTEGDIMTLGVSFQIQGENN